ncbi:MAG: hypothetical protein AB7S44_01535 [Spirochaetales bacterium]
MATDKEVLIEKEAPSFNYFNGTNFSKLEASTKQQTIASNTLKSTYGSSKLADMYERYQAYQELEPETAVEEELDEPSFEEQPLEKTVNKKFGGDFNFERLIKEKTDFDSLQSDEVFKEEEIEERVEKKKSFRVNLNKQSKVGIFTYAFVVVLLGFLLVYNAFAIGNVNANINDLNTNIANEQVKIEQVIKDIGNMTDEDNIIDLATDLSFSEVPMGDIVNVTLYEKQALPTYEVQTNWFDAICKFFSGLFKG